MRASTTGSRSLIWNKVGLATGVLLDGEPGWKRKARVGGFDLDATTEVRGEDRERLEHLCRYLLRPIARTPRAR